MAQKTLALHTRGNFPKTDRVSFVFPAVSGSGGQKLSVRGKGNAEDRPFMPLQNPKLLAAGHVPQIDGLIFLCQFSRPKHVSRGEIFSVGRKSERGYAGLFASKLAHLF